jgi:hypothetical protein
VADDVDELFRVAPEDFVAARNRLAKEWRAAGRRDEAKAVAALRRPTVANWALNAVAGEHAPDAGALVDAAARLRAVQADAVEGRGGDLRTALADLRSASATVHRRADDVLSRAGRDRAAQAAALSTRLNEIAANEEAAAQFAAGRLGGAPVEDVDPFAGLETPPVTPARPPGRSARSNRARPAVEPAPKPDPEATRRHAAERRRLGEALTAARGARTSAEAALTKADAALDRARRAVADAEARRDEARSRLDDAEAAEAEADEAMARHQGTPI